VNKIANTKSQLILNSYANEAKKNTEKCTKLGSADKKTYCNKKKDGEAKSDDDKEENHSLHPLIS
jgi:hypothetical protein